MTRAQKESGFTLTEMLVVMAILAVSLALSLPYARRSTASQQLMAESLSLASALKRARNRAMTNGTAQDLVLDLENRSFRQSESSDSRTFVEGIKLTALSAGGLSPDHKAVFRFYSDGSATGGKIVLEQNGLRYIVAINWLTGAARVENGTQ